MSKEQSDFDVGAPRTGIDHLARAVHQHSDYRVLQRIGNPYESGVMDVPPGGRTVAIVDCETTGLDRFADTIIELGVMMITVDADCQVVGHGIPVTWLEDALFGLDPRIVRKTGITEAMIKGQSIDRGAALALLASADLIVAHHAAFDRAFVERVFPVLDKGWACSCHEVDWDELGFDGRALPWLLVQHGLFSEAHRAGADVWALFTLLQQPVDLADGTVLRLLLEAADQTTYRVEATGSRIEHKDYLKRRGYAWDPNKRVWHITVEASEIQGQRDILEPIGVTEPEVVEQTARERHRY